MLDTSIQSACEGHARCQLFKAERLAAKILASDNSATHPDLAEFVAIWNSLQSVGIVK